MHFPPEHRWKFDSIPNDAAFWECQNCGTGWFSLYSGDYCPGCRLEFESPKKYVGEKTKMKAKK